MVATRSHSSAEKSSPPGTLQKGTKRAMAQSVANSWKNHLILALAHGISIGSTLFELASASRMAYLFNEAFKLLRKGRFLMESCEIISMKSPLLVSN